MTYVYVPGDSTPVRLVRVQDPVDLRRNRAGSLGALSEDSQKLLLYRRRMVDTFNKNIPSPMLMAICSISESRAVTLYQGGRTEVVATHCLGCGLPLLALRLRFELPF